MNAIYLQGTHNLDGTRQAWQSALMFFVIFLSVAIVSVHAQTGAGATTADMPFEISVTTIDDENVRLTTSAMDRVYLGENTIIKFELKNESTDNVWIIDPRVFYFDVYDENNKKIGTWQSPETYKEVVHVGAGSLYGENLMWDLTVWRENFDWYHHWDNWRMWGPDNEWPIVAFIEEGGETPVLATSRYRVLPCGTVVPLGGQSPRVGTAVSEQQAAFVTECWWLPRYERVELGPGTYYLEGHTFYVKWIDPELVTPKLKITISSLGPNQSTLEYVSYVINSRSI